jgi:hypothetical protein
MVGHENLGLAIMVRIHASQPRKYDTLRRNIKRIPEIIDFMSYKQELEKFQRLQNRFKMDLKFESDEERLRYYMGVSPKKKLEWLRAVQEFMCSISPRNRKFFERKFKLNR